MTIFGHCARCQQPIPDERLQISPVVCPSCGHSSTENEAQSQLKLEMDSIKFMVSLAALALLALLHVTQWSGYSLEIIPLKAKQLTGVAKRADLLRIQAICVEQKRLECVEKAIAGRIKTGDVEALAELGKHLVLLNRAQEARPFLVRYFELGGLNLEANYYYAQALAQAGQIDQASRQFERIIEAKPDSLQITVAQTYVRMLMNNGRTQDAIRLINQIRKSSSTAELFMNTEYQQLTQASR